MNKFKEIRPIVLGRGKNSYRLTVSEGFDLNGKPMMHRKRYMEIKKTHFL